MTVSWSDNPAYMAVMSFLSGLVVVGEARGVDETQMWGSGEFGEHLGTRASLAHGLVFLCPVFLHGGNDGSDAEEEPGNPGKERGSAKVGQGEDDDEAEDACQDAEHDEGDGSDALALIQVRVESGPVGEDVLHYSHRSRFWR